MKTKTFYLMLLSVLLLAVVIAGAAYGGRLIVEKIEAVREYRAKERQGADTQSDSRLGQDAETVAQQDAVIRSSFIPSTQVLALIQGLESSAKAGGLRLTVEKVEQGEPRPLSFQAGSTNSVTLSLQAEGTYAAISDFVRKLEAGERGLSVEGFDLYRSQAGAYSARLRVGGIILTP